MTTRILILLNLILLFSCKKEKQPIIVTEDKYIAQKIVVSDLLLNTTWSEHPNEQEINPVIEEISGIIPSLKHSNSYWTHEDSGSTGRLSLYSENGQLLGYLKFPGQNPIDMEDISILIDTLNQDSLISVADIGDNNESRAYVKLITFKERDISGQTEVEASQVKVIKLQYFNQDNQQEKHNCEAMSVDPATGHIYLFTKAASISYIFRLKPPFSYSEYNRLEKIGEFYIRGQKVTASDISISGKQFILKTYDYLFLWNRLQGESFEDMIARSPERIPYFAEVKGEAVCFSKSEDQYLTISEKDNGIEPKFRIYTKHNIK